MLKHRIKLIAATGAVMTAAAIALTGAAAAATAPHHGPAAISGTEHFQIMSTSATSNSASIIGYGPFTAGGTITGTHSSSNKATVKFPNGTFVLTHSKGTGTQHFNPKTCLLTRNVKGTYTLGSGTGAYAQLTGSGNYQLTILAVGAKSGGQCSKTLPPPSFQQVIIASGPVSLR